MAAPPTSQALAQATAPAPYNVLRRAAVTASAKRDFSGTEQNGEVTRIVWPPRFLGESLRGDSAQKNSAVSAKIGPKSDPAAAPKLPDDQWVGRVPTARKRPREGSAFGTTVPGLASAARHAPSCYCENTVWPTPGRRTLHTTCHQGNPLICQTACNRSRPDRLLICKFVRHTRFGLLVRQSSRIPSQIPGVELSL
jgi:hypothetical protein